MPAASAKLYASQVRRLLADAGHQPAHLAEDGSWVAGFRATQCGDDVVVCCEGPLGRIDVTADAARLAEYQLALTNLGYRVQWRPRPAAGGTGTGGAQLIVHRF